MITTWRIAARPVATGRVAAGAGGGPAAGAVAATGGPVAAPASRPCDGRRRRPRAARRPAGTRLLSSARSTSVSDGLAAFPICLNLAPSEFHVRRRARLARLPRRSRASRSWFRFDWSDTGWSTRHRHTGGRSSSGRCRGGPRGGSGLRARRADAVRVGQGLQAQSALRRGPLRVAGRHRPTFRAAAGLGGPSVPLAAVRGRARPGDVPLRPHAPRAFALRAAGHEAGDLVDVRDRRRRSSRRRPSPPTGRCWSGRTTASCTTSRATERSGGRTRRGTSSSARPPWHTTGLSTSAPTTTTFTR